MPYIILLLFIFTQLSCATMSDESCATMSDEKILHSEGNTTWYVKNDHPLPEETKHYSPGLHIFLKPPQEVFDISRKSSTITEKYAAELAAFRHGRTPVSTPHENQTLGVVKSDIPIRVLQKDPDGHETLVNVLIALEHNTKTNVRLLYIDKHIPLLCWKNITKIGVPNATVDADLADLVVNTYSDDNGSKRHFLFYPLPRDTEAPGSFLRIESSPQELLLIDYWSCTSRMTEIFSNLPTVREKVWSAKTEMGSSRRTVKIETLKYKD